MLSPSLLFCIGMLLFCNPAVRNITMQFPGTAARFYNKSRKLMHFSSRSVVKHPLPSFLMHSEWQRARKKGSLRADATARALPAECRPGSQIKSASSSKCIISSKQPRATHGVTATYPTATNWRAAASANRLFSIYSCQRNIQVGEAKHFRESFSSGSKTPTPSRRPTFCACLIDFRSRDGIISWESHAAISDVSEFPPRRLNKFSVSKPQQCRKVWRTPEVSAPFKPPVLVQRTQWILHLNKASFDQICLQSNFVWHLLSFYWVKWFWLPFH
jgi:hypothetical protein